MSNALVPSHYYDDDDGLYGMQLANMAQMSPEAAARFERAITRVKELETMAPAVENLSSAAADALRARVMQTRRPIEAGFEVHAGDSCCGWFSCSCHHVHIKGRVWVSGAD